jgi:hypothetical protein
VALRDRHGPVKYLVRITVGRSKGKATGKDQRSLLREISTALNREVRAAHQRGGYGAMIFAGARAAGGDLSAGVSAAAGSEGFGRPGRYGGSLTVTPRPASCQGRGVTVKLPPARSGRPTPAAARAGPPGRRCTRARRPCKRAWRRPGHRGKTPLAPPPGRSWAPEPCSSWSAQ